MYIGKEAFKVTAGKCVFCSKSKPHAFLARSPRLHALILVTPGGLEEAFRSETWPAQYLDVPTKAPTYSTTDAQRTAQRLTEGKVE